MRCRRRIRWVTIRWESWSSSVPDKRWAITEGRERRPFVDRVDPVLREPEDERMGKGKGEGSLRRRERS